MSTLIKLHPSLDIFSKRDAIEPGAGLAKMDIICYNAPDLYNALLRFCKRFPNITQDVTDPVSPLDRISRLALSPISIAMILPRPKLTIKIFLPDPFGSGEVSPHDSRGRCALNG